MSFSDDSDLTDLSSSEDEGPLASASQKAKAKAVAPEYQVKNSLKPPRTTQYTAKSLYDQIIENTIDLDPEYQREVVWPEHKMSGIIDSILRNYYVPPVIFAVSYSDDGSELRTCIDGKQRLTSIVRFIDGLIPHKDAFTGHRLWYTAPNGKRKLLPAQLKTKFTNKQIVCVEYEGLSGDQERELFQRVQLGVALTPAERMQAITGPWPSFVRSLKASAFAPSGFANHLDWASARGRDFQCVGTILYHLCKPTAAHPGATQLETWLSADAPVPEKFRQDVEEAFAVYIALVRAFHAVFHEPTKLAPVEFVMVGVLVSKYGKKMSMKGLAEAVKGMRADVRRKHSDIRMNGKVTKTTLEYIRQVEVGVLKKGEKSAVEEMKATAGSVTGVKRKRKVVQSEDDGESEDSEARPPPSKPKPTPAAAPKSTPKPKSKPVTKPVTSKTPKPSTSSTPKPTPSIPRAATPRITKPPSKATAPPPSNDPLPMSLPSLPRREPSLPPIAVKREPSVPPDRLGPIRAAKTASSESPVIPTASFNFNFNHNPNPRQPNGGGTVHDPRRAAPLPLPPPPIQTNSQQQQPYQPPSARLTWASLQSPSTPVFPPGTPLDQTNIHTMLSRAGISTQGVPGQNTSPRVPESLSLFTQNPQNPLHVGPSSGWRQSPTGPRAAAAAGVNGGGGGGRHSPPPLPPPSASSSRYSSSSFQPPPTSASSASSAFFPPTSASSSSSWHPDSHDRERERERERERDGARRTPPPPAHSRPPYLPARPEPADSYRRRSPEPRGRATRWAADRDQGWGSRGRGRSRRGGSPESDRYRGR